MLTHYAMVSKISYMLKDYILLWGSAWNLMFLLTFRCKVSVFEDVMQFPSQMRVEVYLKV